MKPIPCYRATHLRPYLEFLRGVGAPVERGLRQAKLPTMLNEGDDLYLPLFPSNAFLVGMSRQEGIDEMPLRALRQIRITDLSESFVAAAFHSPTLKVALASFRELVHLEDPYVDFWICPGETTVKLCILNRLSMDPQALRHEDWIENLVLVAIVQAFAGPTWQPKEMAFRSNFPFGQFAMVQLPNTRFLINQESAGIIVPRKLLSLPPLARPDAAGAQGTPDSAQGLNGALTWDFPSSLRKVLAAYLGDGGPSVQLAAELAGTSVRTLQRRLGQFNTNFSELVQHTRFEAAAKLLRDTELKTLDIAYELGYEDPSHFARAFRRITGISPREFRSHFCPQ